MATDLERLVVSLEASITKFEKEMKRSRTVTDGAMRDVERSVVNGQRRVEAAMSRIGAGIKGAIAGALAGISLQQISQMADQYTKIQNALKVTGLEGAKLSQTYEALYAISQQQAAPLDAMATLYSRLSAAQKDLNATGPEMLRVTEGVAMALKVSGTSANEASGALLQLGQALSGGKVQAEEYNSLLDGARPVLQAVANGMAEAGGSVSKLTALVKDGKVSSEAFFRAFLAGMPTLEKQAASAGLTTSQAMGKIGDALVNLVGKLSDATGASRSAAESLSGVANAVNNITNYIPNAVEALAGLQAKLTEIGNSSIWRKIYEGADALGLGGMNGVENLNRFDQVFGAKTSAGSMAGYKPGGASPASVKPIRNADYKVPGDDSKGGSKQKLDDYQRETQQIKERTAAIQQESMTVGQSAGEIAKAEAAFKLLEAAKKANVAITPQLKADIEAVAQAYGEATTKLDAARQAQQQFVELQQFVGESISGFLSDIVSGGKNAEEAIMNLTKRLADMALQAALLGQGPLAGLFGTAGTNGGVGGLIGALFKGFTTGKASGGLVKPGMPYTVGETGRETFIPTTPGRIVPNGKMGGGAVTVNMGSTTVNAPGGDPKLIAAMLDQRDRAMVAKLPALIRNAQGRGQLRG